MSNPTFSHRATATRQPQNKGNSVCDFDAILALARESGLLITLDGQIGREKYQSVAGSLHAFQRFAEALCEAIDQIAPA
ncbi:hypothetical protein PQR10_02725 [Paraburkholderia phytofirmans]|uniref:Uncharacterized protein n=1 Tax=Paraburkholderia phytofirmans TaxID=261302 RepID=A0ABW9BCZ7_9BURK